MKIVVFDTETTGLPLSRNASVQDSQQWPHIVQLSFLVYDNEKGALIRMGDHLLRLPEGMAVPSQSTAIHGITTGQLLRKGIPTSDGLDDLLGAMREADWIVAHNLDFDKNMVMAECFRCGKAEEFRTILQGKREYCTMQNGKAECALLRKRPNGSSYLKYPKLGELYEHLFQASPRGVHDAMADGLICLRCFAKMTEQADPLKDASIKKQFEMYRI